MVLGEAVNREALNGEAANRDAVNGRAINSGAVWGGEWLTEGRYWSIGGGGLYLGSACGLVAGLYHLIPGIGKDVQEVQHVLRGLVRKEGILSYYWQGTGV